MENLLSFIPLLQLNEQCVTLAWLSSWKEVQKRRKNLDSKSFNLNEPACIWTCKAAKTFSWGLSRLALAQFLSLSLARSQQAGREHTNSGFHGRLLEPQRRRKRNPRQQHIRRRTFRFPHNGHTHHSLSSRIHTLVIIIIIIKAFKLCAERQ